MAKQVLFHEIIFRMQELAHQLRMLHELVQEWSEPDLCEEAQELLFNGLQLLETSRNCERLDEMAQEVEDFIMNWSDAPDDEFEDDEEEE